MKTSSSNSNKKLYSKIAKRPASSKNTRPGLSFKQKKSFAGLLVMAVISLGLAVYAFHTAGTSHASSSRFTVLTLNACGVTCNKGEINNRASLIASEATGNNADLMFLNEICYSQYKAVQKLLAAKGYDTEYVSSTQIRSCDNYTDSAHRAEYGTGFGNAVISRAPIRGDRIVTRLLNSDNHEPRTLLCVNTSLTGRAIKACTAHLDQHLSTATPQAKQVAGILNGYVAQGPVVFGGDMNFEPSNKPLSTLFYSPLAGGYGLFREADETYTGAPAIGGRITAGFGPGETPHKIDYIFLSRQYMRYPSATIVSDKLSDHKLLVGHGGWQE